MYKAEMALNKANYPKDYHDYVFKNGKLLGKFEQMYRYSKDIPWHQDKTAYADFSDRDLEILRQYNYDTICDIGCGLGYFTQRLYTELRSNDHINPKIVAMDISEAAVKKAQILFPGINFIRCDLLKQSPQINNRFDLVVVKEVMWYIASEYKHFFSSVVNLVKTDGFLYISQSFPNADEWIGQEIFDSPETLLGLLLRYAKPVDYRVKKDEKLYRNGYLHFLGKKRKT